MPQFILGLLKGAVLMEKVVVKTMIFGECTRHRQVFVTVCPVLTPSDRTQQSIKSGLFDCDRCAVFAWDA
jgi:hypothetical protein